MVSVDTTTAQSQFNIVQDALEKRLRLLLCKHNVAEPGSWIAHSTDILHQDCIPDLRERSGHVSAMRIEQALCLILVLDPRYYLGGASSLSLACCSAAAPAVTMLCLPLFIALDSAEAIDGIIAQAAEHARAINLRRQVLHSRRRMSLAAVNGGLLSTMNFVQDICDQMLVIERRQ